MELFTDIYIHLTNSWLYLISRVRLSGWCVFSFHYGWRCNTSSLLDDLPSLVEQNWSELISLSECLAALNHLLIGPYISLIIGHSICCMADQTQIVRESSKVSKQGQSYRRAILIGHVIDIYTARSSVRWSCHNLSRNVYCSLGNLPTEPSQLQTCLFENFYYRHRQQ